MPSPYIAVSHLIIESREQLAAGFGAVAEELLEDKLEFTDIEIIAQISEVIGIWAAITSQPPRNQLRSVCIFHSDFNYALIH